MDESHHTSKRRRGIIKWILDREGVQLHIIDVLEDQSAKIALVSSFTGKLYGLRSHKRQRLVEKVKEELFNSKTET